MCNMCDESEDGFEVCQDCQSMICFDDGSAYVTASGDLFCVRCGRDYDEAEEQAWEDDWGWSYPVSWHDPGSDLDQLEDPDEPRTVWIGPVEESPGQLLIEAEEDAILDNEISKPLPRYRSNEDPLGEA